MYCYYYILLCLCVTLISFFFVKWKHAYNHIIYLFSYDKSKRHRKQVSKENKNKTVIFNFLHFIKKIVLGQGISMQYGNNNVEHCNFESLQRTYLYIYIV